MIFRFIKNKVNENSVLKLKRQSWLSRIGIITIISQYVLISILVFILLEITFTSSYYLYLVDAVLWTSEILSIVILGFFSYRFFSWYRFSRNNLVLGYALAIAMLSINAAFSLAYLSKALEDDPVYVAPLRDPAGAYFTADNTLYTCLVTSGAIAFAITWFATALLLRNYAKKLGKIKYWIIVTIPLVYFSAQFQPLFPGMFTDFRLSDPYLFNLLYSLFFSVTRPAGAVLFGVAFWVIARAIDHKIVKYYMMISAYGMMLLFASNQAIVLDIAPYPPFGLATVSYIGLSSYLLLMGVYLSARSVSQDVELRTSIRHSVEHQSRLLETIGRSEMEQEIEKRVKRAFEGFSF